MFILFNEEEAVLEFAKRGLSESRYNLFTKSRKWTPTREPLVGWKCSYCCKVMTLKKAPEGFCTTCLSANLEPIFGHEIYNKLLLERNRTLREIKLQERKQHD